MLLFLIPLFCVGSNVPDGCGSAGIHAGQQGPAACGWDWAPTATGLLPVPGALPRRVHACAQARAGTERWGFLAGNASFLDCTEKYVVRPWIWVCKARNRERFQSDPLERAELSEQTNIFFSKHCKILVLILPWEWNSLCD